jgi:hypothetical protein
MSSFTRYAIGVGAAVLLAGCGSASNVGAPIAGGVAETAPTHHRTFYYVDNVQRFKVPAGVTSITVVALGAHGGADKHSADPGRVYAVVPVQAKETLYVYVGGAGAHPEGGFNGGGNGGAAGYGPGHGGGGASDIREGGTSVADRIIVAGGGGGTGGPGYGRDANGGKGGGKTGGRGESGWAGSSGNNGGGGGGGGYYGGGGGGQGDEGQSGEGGGGGGGGGSSYVEPSASRYQMWQGWSKAPRDGLVVISW